MARDRRPDSDTDELPTAALAFTTRGTDREEDAMAVSRAGALLALVKPPKLSMTEFRSVTTEAREILDLDPVEPQEDDNLDRAFQQLGTPGQKALEVSRALKRRRPQEADAEREGELPPSQEASLSALLRASTAERSVIEGVQAELAGDVFSAGDLRAFRCGRIQLHAS